MPRAHVILLMIALFAGGIFAANDECPGCVPCTEDFSPCSCIIFEEGVINVECDQVPFADVQSAFTVTTTTNLIRLFLTVSDSTASVPANLLGDNKAKEISITCLNRNFRLVINRDSFRASAAQNKLTMFQGCELSQLDLTFLSNFQSVSELSITNSTIASLSTLPVLPSLTRLIVANCQGFTSWGNPSLTSVRELYLNNNLLSDRSIITILDSITASSNSLEALYLHGNSLTRVPDKISALSTLSVLNLNGNIIPTVATGSLSFRAPQVKSVRLEGVELTTIEAGTFSGNFTGAVVLLTANELTRFDANVFQSMLTDMRNTTGFLQMYFNPIECDCSIAWLIRDNRDLLPQVFGGTCSNSTAFEYLDPAGFASCP